MTLRRTPFRRGGKFASDPGREMSRSRLKPVSDKRRSQADEYADAKATAWDRDRGRCQAERSWPEVACGGRLDPHHIRPVNRFPELRCDPDNLTTLCRAHHDAAHHEDPVRARALGLLV